MQLQATRKYERGATLVEFALAMTVILTLLLGTVDLGRALFAYDWVSNAARQGTRFAMVRGTNCTELSGGCPATNTDITNYLYSLGSGINTSALTITSGCYSTTFVSSPPCAPQSNVEVSVQYTFTFISPLSPHSWTMSSTSQRVVQN